MATDSRLKWLLLSALGISLSSKPVEAKIFQSFQTIVRQVEPSVVHIRSKERPNRLGTRPDPYSYFFQTAPAQNTGSFPLGSGFLIQPLGYLVTSFQIVEGIQNFEIVTSSNQRLAADYVGGDRQNDLALLRIKASKGLRALDFADSDRLEVGDPVLGLGFPLGFGSLLSSGTIASLGGVMGAGPFNGHIITDFSTNASNAGGPLLDSRGRVLGLLASPQGAPSGLGFALPAKLLQSLVRDLMKHGKLQRPWLGLVVKNLASIDAGDDLSDPKLHSGILISNLIVDGPAAHAKLQVGDLILGVGKHKIQSIHDLQAYLRNAKAGEKVAVKLYRRRQGELELPLKLGDIPGAEDLPQEQDLY